MRDNLIDVDSHVVHWFGIPVGPSTCLFYDGRNVVVAKKEKLSRGDTIDSKRFPEGNGEKISPTNNADSSSNWIQNGIVSVMKLAKAKFCGLLSKRKWICSDWRCP